MKQSLNEISNDNCMMHQSLLSLIPITARTDFKNDLIIFFEI
jgi:hypothetical protein